MERGKTAGQVERGKMNRVKMDQDRWIEPEQDRRTKGNQSREMNREDGAGQVDQGRQSGTMECSGRAIRR